MKNFNFIANKKIMYIVVAVIFIIGIASFLIRGFNLDIDFAGGSEMTISLGKEVTSSEQEAIKDIVIDIVGQTRYSSVSQSAADTNVVIIRTNQLTPEEIDEVYAAIKDKYSLTEEAPDSIQSTSATIGDSTKRTAIISSLVAVVLMLIYITIRFQFTSGLASVCCLIFNIFTMFTLYSALQIPLNSNVIAACLTILGYSINATIVIFDRIRENLKSESNFAISADNGVHQTFWRSVNTTLTTLFTIGMIYIFGVESIRNFALPLIVGIIAGLFSSVCLAAPIWGEFRKLFRLDKGEKK